jgi:hypothetical protein
MKDHHTSEHFIVSILSFEFHLCADIEILYVIFVLCHSLKHAELHINQTLGANIIELIQWDSTLKLL